MSEPPTEQAETTPEPEPQAEPPEPTPAAPDEDEDDETPAPTGEPEQAPPPVQSPQDAAKMIRELETKVQKERQRHASRLGEILGDASTETLPCPLCFDGLQGYVFPGDADEIDQAQKTAALAFLGEGADDELEPAEGVQECPRCKGKGQLRYPTHVEHVKAQSCPRCQATGYVAVQAEPAPAAAFQFPPPVVAPPSNGVAGNCPLCGQAGMAGQPHWCQPAPVAAV